MKSIISYLTESNNGLLEDLRYARNKISQIDALINGIKDALEEHKEDVTEEHTQEIEKLHSLQEEMEAIISDIYKCEGGKY